jgi:hypothetical protein
VLITAGYALFQTANNTALMAGADPARRGLLSGLLNLSRNLGLVTGASVMGALFMAAAGGGDILAVDPGSVAMATRITFAVAGAGAGGPWVGRLRASQPSGLKPVGMDGCTVHAGEPDRTPQKGKTMNLAYRWIARVAILLANTAVIAQTRTGPACASGCGSASSSAVSPPPMPPRPGPPSTACATAG